LLHATLGKETTAAAPTQEQQVPQAVAAAAPDQQHKHPETSSSSSSSSSSNSSEASKTSSSATPGSTPAGGTDNSAHLAGIADAPPVSPKTEAQLSQAQYQEIYDRLIKIFQDRPREDWKRLIVFSKQWPQHKQGVLDR